MKIRTNKAKDTRAITDFPMGSGIMVSSKASGVCVCVFSLGLSSRIRPPLSINN